jgi:hypothetical protein
MNRGFAYLISLTLLLAGFAPLVRGQENQLLNPEFDNGTNSWGLYGEAGFTFSVVPGARLSGSNAALLDVTDGSVTSIGIYQGGLSFEKGKTYPVGVTAKADRNREMVILIQLYKPEVPTWVDIVLETAALTTEPQTFLFEYTHTDDSMAAHPAWQATLYLMLKGQWWTIEGSTLISKVWVDRVHVGQQPPLIDSTVRSASEPQPANEAADVPNDTTLAWMSGEGIASHHVYFGTAFEDVNAADLNDPRGVLVSEGRTAAEFVPGNPLEFGQTYYWRVDEVNATADRTIFKGKVWSFTVEPYAYPISGITATASASASGMDPQNTVNGSGLNEFDQHSTNSNDMWLSVGTLPAWIQFEFDRVYKLDEMWVWNSNQLIESMLGFGAKNVVIEYSTDGEAWTALENVPEFSRSPGSITYTADTTVDFQGAMARYVRLTVNSNWGGITKQAGLSEVRFFYIPTEAREPVPSDGATGVSVEARLNWRPGRETTSHIVYLGTDRETVAAGSVPGQTVSRHGYTPADLLLGTEYFWKVDEVEDAGAYPGGVWRFATEPYLVVEDFEKYNDDDNRIYQTWVDGVTDKASGSQVGYNESPFAEKTIVHGGRQSMPLIYNNAFYAFSQTTRTFDPAQAWSVHGIKTLSLNFAGTAGNTGQLYVAIGSVKVVYSGDAADLARAGWQSWNIDLSAIAGLDSVKSLTIGVEGSRAAGTLYIDDIRVSPKTPQFLTPAEPGAAGLVARWAFDGNVQDSSGKGRNGTASGGPTYVPGIDGQALYMDGINDYVVVGSVGISGAAPRTISGWIKADDLSIADWTTLFGFTSTPDAGAALSFDMEKIGGTTNYGIHVYGWERSIMPIDMEWHHLAATYDGTTIAWYGDGLFVGAEAWTLNTQDNVQMGKRGHAAGGYFPGMIDEVRIYNKALSAEEIAWLAGRRLPVHLSQ